MMAYYLGILDLQETAHWLYNSALNKEVNLKNPTMVEFIALLSAQSTN